MRSMTGMQKVLMGLVLALGCGAVQAAPINLRVDVHVDGAWSWGANQPAIEMANGNYTVADGSYINEQSGYSLSWSDVEFHTDPFISLNQTLTNNTGLTQSFLVSTSLPIAPPILPSSLMGGSAGYTLTDDNFSGSALLSTTALGTSLYTGVIDGVDVLPLFPHLSTLAVGTAGGTNSMTANVGLPIPSIPGPAALATIGIKHSFTLTPGDSVSFTSFFIVEVPEPGTLGLLLAGGALLLRRKR